MSPPKKGIASPWARAAEPDEPEEVRAKPGRTPVRVAGREYVFVVVLPIQLPEAKAKATALKLLGEAIWAILQEHPKLLDEFRRQKLALAPERPLGPCVEMALGERTLVGAASSGDVVAASAMVVDRLALALSRLFGQTPPAREILGRHFTTLLREHR